MPSRRPRRLRLDLALPPQPTDTSCGPTCLHAIYAYWGEDVPVERIVGEIPELETGGTLAVQLGIHALRRGYRARLFTYNLRIFDPTWFDLPPEKLRAKLATQVRVRTSPKRRLAARYLAQFHDLGGELRFDELTGGLLRRYLRRGQPILTGLSATYLYAEPREIPETNQPDDVRGEPSGHFVILSGYDSARRVVFVADPLETNPISPERHYPVGIERLINAILLGVLTYDAHLLLITPRSG